jgi:hypothetical protein
MHTIPPPADSPAIPGESSSGPAIAGLVALIVVLGGVAAYLSHFPPPQLIAWLQPPATAPATTGPSGIAAPLDTTPLAEPALGFAWLFDEKEWRTPENPLQEYKEGLVRVRTVMERKQPAADATIRARIVVREGSGIAGVFLRSTPEEGRYRLAIDPDLRFVRLVHQGPAGTHELGKHRFFRSLLKGDRVVLELDAEGDKLSGLVNGERVIDAVDTRSFKAGTWGIESTDGWFELVEVPLPPPGGMIAQAEPATRPVAATPAPKAAAGTPAPAAPASATAPMPATPAPAPMAEPAPVGPLSETGKWLASMEPQWQAAFEKEVLAPYVKSLADLRTQFIGMVETQLAAATQARKLDDAAFFRGERKRLEAGEDVPMTDESIVPPALKNLRNGYRTELARHDKGRFERAKTFFAKTDTILAQNQATLTQRQRNAEALEVKAKRDQLAALWVKPPVSIAPAAATPATATAAATPAPARPAIGATPSPTIAKMPARQVVEKLLALGAGVSVTPRGSEVATEVEEISKLPGERFEITTVNFPLQPPKPLTAEDLAILEALHDVKVLSLRGSAVTDAVLEKIRPFRQLEILTLEGAAVTAASAPVLSTLTGLKELQLRNMGLGDEAIKALAQCRKIEELHLVSLPIGDEALATVGKLPSLERLWLTNVDKVTSAGVGHLAECRSLRRLYLTGSGVSSPTLDAVARCSSLEFLSLAGNALKDDQIAGLSALTRLQTLNLSNTGIVGTAFAKWGVRSSLTTLNMTNQPGVNDVALKAIGAAFPKLENLDITGLPFAATSEGFAAIGRLRSLRTLEVRGGVVNDEIMGEIAKCNDLATLTIPAAKLTDPGIVALARLGKLTRLDLDAPPVTEAALKALARCKTLRSLGISAETPAEVETKLRAALPNVEIRK